MPSLKKLMANPKKLEQNVCSSFRKTKVTSTTCSSKEYSTYFSWFCPKERLWLTSTPTQLISLSQCTSSVSKDLTLLRSHLSLTWKVWHLSTKSWTKEWTSKPQISSWKSSAKLALTTTFGRSKTSYLSLLCTKWLDCQSIWMVGLSTHTTCNAASWLKAFHCRKMPRRGALLETWESPKTRYARLINYSTSRLTEFAKCNSQSLISLTSRFWALPLDTSKILTFTHT
jgi:hypothetical protein